MPNQRLGRAFPLGLLLLCSAPTRAMAAPPAPVGVESIPIPAVPDAANFDALLYFLARPPAGEHRALVVPDANLALSSGATGLLPLDRKYAGSWQMLAAPAMGASVSELPAGSRIAGWLAPAEGGPLDLKVRDLSHFFVEKGPLQRMEHALFGRSQGGEVAAGIVGGLAAVGMISTLGTSQAALLGFKPAVTETVLDGRLSGTFGLRSEKHFSKAYADSSARVRLFHNSSDTAASGLFSRDLFVEAGATYNHNVPDQARYQNQWLRLRAGGRLLDSAVGVHYVVGDPLPWADLDGTLHGAGPYRMRLTLSQQAETEITQVTSALTRRMDAGTAGIFLGAHNRNGVSAGVMAMTVF